MIVFTTPSKIQEQRRVLNTTYAPLDSDGFVSVRAKEQAEIPLGGHTEILFIL